MYINGWCADVMSWNWDDCSKASNRRVSRLTKITACNDPRQLQNQGNWMWKIKRLYKNTERRSWSVLKSYSDWSLAITIESII